METAIRQLMRDPVVSLPVLCLVLLLAALIAGVLRSAQNGTFELPAINAWTKDLSQVLLITLVLFLSKLTSILIPEGSIEVFGVDLAPLLSVAAPGVFFVAGATAAGTFILRQANAVRDSLQPPTPALVAERAAKVELGEAIGDPVPKA